MTDRLAAVARTDGSTTFDSAAGNTQALIEASSFGTVGARELRSRAPEAIVEGVLAGVVGAGSGAVRAIDGPTLVEIAAADLCKTDDDKYLADSRLIGYRGPVACAAAGITYRQLDYWARTGLVRASIHSGSEQLYSVEDILVLKVVKRLLDACVVLEVIRGTIEYLRSCCLDDLATLTLLSDGQTLYECRSPEDIVELLSAGQGVFGLSVGGALRELKSVLAELQSEDAQEGHGVRR